MFGRCGRALVAMLEPVYFRDCEQCENAIDTFISACDSRNWCMVGYTVARGSTLSTERSDLLVGGLSEATP